MNKCEQTEYDKRWADENDGYSAARIGYTPNFLRFMTEHLSGLAAPAALEIGCGDGFFSGELAKRGSRVTGVDLSPEGVAKAQKRVPDGRFLVHDLSERPPTSSPRPTRAAPARAVPRSRW